MDRRYELGRAHTSEQQYPPLPQKGRPPYSSERPHSAHSERAYRNSSKSSRLGMRSRSHQGRDHDLVTAESDMEMIKTTRPRGPLKRFADHLSSKAFSKHQFSMDNGRKELDVPKSPTATSSTTSMMLRPRGRKAAGGHFDPSVHQRSSITASQATSAGNGVINYDQVHVTQEVIKAPVQTTAMEAHKSTSFPSEAPQPDKTKDLPPDPPAHRNSAVEALGLEKTANAQDECGKIIENLQKIINEQQERINDLKAEQHVLYHERSQRLLQVQHKDDEIEMWKTRAIDAASKSADVPAQAPLSQPQSELLKDWQNLAFDVRNLVANHFGGVRETKIVSWAKDSGDWLQEVTLNPLQVASGKRSGPALKEAAIWYWLVKWVFGGIRPNAPMCWAGGYKQTLQRLTRKLQKDFARTEPGQQYSLYCQWKALTASIVSTVQHTQDHDREVEDVVDDLEALVPPCRSRIANSKAYRHELQAVVNKAIELDLRFSGQKEHYFVRWPGQVRYNVDLDQDFMKLAAGSPQGSRNVRFMIQPCLCQAQGIDDVMMVDHCSVWMS